MRTATVTEFGGPEVFRVVQQADPAPAAGEVVIDVAVADTLWLETLVRTGAGRDHWPMRPPYVPGDGVAGRISRVGEAVDSELLGARVVAHTGNEGGYADRAVVAAEAVSLVPDELGLPMAAALLHDAPTALALFATTRVGADDTVLVVGASGGLGVLSIQLGRARAGRVVALARGAKLERVRELGTDAVIDSGLPDWVEQTRSVLPARGADVVLDNIGGDLGETSFTLTAAGGRFSGHGTPSGRFARIEQGTAERLDVTVTGIEAVQLPAAERKRHTDQALREAADGTITPVIGKTFPLERAGDAHTAIQDRHVFGKTLITT